jgi:flagellar hook assembly protein FlgD
LVKILINGNQKLGYYSIKWDGTATGGRKLSSGIYFIRLEAENYTETEKIYLIK